MASSGDIFLNAKVRVDRRGLERDINSAFRGIGRNATFSPTVNTRGFTQPLGRITGQLGEFDKSLDAATARVLAFSATTAVINGVQNSFAALVRETIAVEEALTQINVVLNTSTRQLENFGGQLFDIARRTQQTFLAAAEAATEFSRQGLSLEETLQRTNDALILTRLSGLDATKAVEALTAAVNGFARAGIDTTEVINKLANVDAAFAVSTRDLTEALSRAGSTAQDANVSFDELLGLVTSVQQQTARGGSVIGNAFKTIFARVGRSTTIEQLRELGVAIDESQSGVERLRAIGDAIQQALGAGNEGAANRIRELSGGVRQINIVAAAFNDLNREVSIFDQALQTSLSSTDQAIRRNERLNQTLAALANESLVQIQELLSGLGEIGVSDNLRTAFEAFNSLLGGINEFIDGEGIGADIGQSLISGIGNFIAGPGLIIFGRVFLRFFTQIAKDALSALKNLGAINTEATRQENIQRQIQQILTTQNAELQEQLANASSRAEREKIILGIINQQIAATERLNQISASIARSPAVGRALDRRRRTPNAAGGMITSEGSGIIEAISNERRAILGGVGGASPLAKPVLIEDFKFGDGRVGPIVANSDEVVFRNFQNTGSDAILTPEMIEQLGGLKAVESLGGNRVPNAQAGFFPEDFQTPQLPTGSLAPLRDASGKQLRQETINFNRALRDLRKGLETGNVALTNAARKFNDEAQTVTSRFSNETKQLIRTSFRQINDQFTRVQSSPPASPTPTVRPTAPTTPNRPRPAILPGEGRLLPPRPRGIGERARAGINRFGGSTVGVSIASSLLAPFFSQAAENTRGPASTALRTGSGALTGASIGALFGPVGIAVGSLTIGLGSLIKALDTASNNTRDLTENLDEQRSRATELNNSFQQFITQQSALNELIESGADSSRLRQASIELQNSLGSIEDRGLQSQIGQIISNPNLTSEDQIDALQRLASNQQQIGERQIRLLDAILRANEAEVEGRGALNLGGILGETNIDSDTIRGIAAEINSAINLASREIQPGELESQFTRISNTFRELSENFDEGQLIDALTELGVSSEEARQLLEGLGEDLDRLELLNEIRQNLDISEEVNEFIEATVRYRKSLRETNRTFDNIVSSTNRIARTVDENSTTRFRRDQGQLESRFATAQFRDPVAEAVSELALELRDIDFQTNRRQNEVSDAFRNSVADLLDRDTFDSEVTRLLEDIATNPNFSLDVDTFQQIADTIESTGNDSLEAYNKIINLGLDSLGELNSINETNQQQRDQLRQQLDIARRRAAEERRQARVNFLGGAQNILSGQNQFSTLRQRDRLSNISDRGGLAGEVALNQQARALIDLRESFDDLDINLGDRFERQFTDVVGGALRTGIERNLESAGFNTQSPEIQGFVDRIIQAQIANITGENELTAQEIANELELRLGEDLSSTAENTRESKEFLRILIDRFDVLSRLLTERQQLTDLQDVSREIAGEINTLRSNAQTTQSNLTGRVLSSQISGNFSASQLESLFGEESITAAFNEANRQRENLDRGVRANIEVPTFTREDFLERAVQELNNTLRRNPSASAEETFDIIARENRNFLSNIIEASPTFRATEEGLQGGENQLAQFLVDNQAVIDIGQNIDQLRDNLNDLNTQIEAATRRFNEAEARVNLQAERVSLIEDDFTVLNTFNTNASNRRAQTGVPVDDISLSNPPIPTQNVRNETSVNRAAELVENIPLFFEQALNQATAPLTERQRSISNITGASVRGGQFVGNDNQIAQANFLDSQDLRSQVETINSGTLTTRELEAALQSLDEQLEALKLDLDDENIQRFLFGQNAGTTISFESLNESLRVIREEARATGEIIKDTFEDPFSTFADRSDVLLDAAIKLEFLKEKFGAASVEVQQFRDSLEGFGEEIPEGVFDRFFSGFLSQADRVDQALADIGQLGRDVSDQLSSGFADAFLGAISGTQDLQTSLRSLFSQVFADMARLLAQRAFAQAFGGIGTLFGGLNEGGSVQALNTGGRVLRRNSGGSIFGASDRGKMPTLLTGGEFVAGPDLVKKYGKSFFESLNSQDLDISSNVGSGSLSSLNANSTGLVKGGSGIKDDQFHMLYEGSYVLNRAATRKYKDVLSDVQKGKDVQIDRRRSQEAFWGMLIGSVLGGVVGYATTGDWKGAAVGAIGGAFLGQGVSNLASGSSFLGSGGIQGFFNPTVAEGASAIGQVAEGASTVGQIAQSSADSVQVAGTLSQSTQQAVLSNSLVGQAAESGFGFEKAIGSLTTATDTAQTAATAADSGNKLTSAAVNLGGSLITQGIALALAPEPPDVGLAGGAAYSPGFVIDTQPDGTVSVMGDKGLQSFRLGEDIQSLEELKGIVPGYNRGGSVSSGEGNIKVRDGSDLLSRGLKKRGSQTGIPRIGSPINAASGFANTDKVLNQLNGGGILLRNQGGGVTISHFKDAAVKQNFLEAINNRIIANETPESLRRAELFKDNTTPNTPVSTLIEKQLTNTLNKLTFNSAGSGLDVLSLNTGGSVGRQDSIYNSSTTNISNSYQASDFARPVSPLIMGGDSTKDSVPALLKKSEFVMKDAAVNTFGFDFMNKVNNSDVNGVRDMLNVTRMQDGGLVGEREPERSSPRLSLMRGETVNENMGGGGTQNLVDISININIDGQTGAVTSDSITTNNNQDPTRRGNDERRIDAERFTRLAQRLRPVIREEVANELRVGGQIDRKMNR